jgi:hypothetical protein
VFNCHAFLTQAGQFDGLDLGTGIEFKDLKHFSQLRNLVDAIYINACAAARGAVGKKFCGELARRTQATVYAADSNQCSMGSSLQEILRGDVIDDFAGQVFMFGKSGQSKPVTLTSE